MSDQRDIDPNELPVPVPPPTDETFRLLVEGVKDYAIFMLDPTGHIITWNAGAQRIKGYTAADVLGRHMSMFYTQADLARNWPRHELAIAVKEGRYEEEGIRVRKDGSQFFANVLITALFRETGELRGFAKITRDITERKQAERSLWESEERLRTLNNALEQRVQERTQQLEETNQELESFCYSVSHDLRAPLRGMQGFAQALQEDYGEKLDQTANDYLVRIIRAAKRMEMLIQDLLDYSRLSRDEFGMGAVSLNAVLDDALAQISRELEERGGSIQVDAPLPSVQANRGVLLRVAANLLSNALKFVESGRKPFVRVHAERCGTMVRVWVDDNGIGIAPEHRERIFRVFERLHGVDKYPGTGIGLAIVRKGLERMGGAVGVESSPGHGSRFWFELRESAEID